MVIRVSFVGSYRRSAWCFPGDFQTILKARRTWSMTSFGMKTRREGAQVMKMIELPLAIINTTRISLHKDKVFSRA
ncbi:hypothetical protein HanPSC8_Chr04g0169831 [Helianthus annuus]|nr:hypothetical protein HanPSC8_Chr04g0169831 [Helianthus annuus]